MARVEGTARSSEGALMSLVRLIRPAEAIVLTGIVAIVATFARLAAVDGDVFAQVKASSYLIASVPGTIAIALPSAVLVVIVAYSGAFTLRFALGRRALYGVFFMLWQFLVSYHVLLLAWRSIWGNDGWLGSAFRLFSYGAPATVAVMVVRYLPISLLLQYMHLEAIAPAQLLCASNHRASPWRFHWRVVLPWSRPVLGLIFVFVFFLAALDPLAPSVAGGGRLQTTGLLIVGLDGGYNLTSVKMLIGLGVVLAVLGLALLAQRTLRDSSVDRPAEWAGREERVSLRRGHMLLMAVPVAITAVLQLMVIVAILSMGLWPNAPSGSAESNARLYEHLRDGLVLSGAVASFCVAAATLSVAAGHAREQLGKSQTRASAPAWRRQLGLMQAVMLLPLVLPGTVVALAINSFQGKVLGRYGSVEAVFLAHSFCFIPLAFFVVNAGLVKFPTAVMKAAANLRVVGWRYWVFIVARSLWLNGLLAWLLVLCASLNEAILARYIGGDFESFAVAVANSQLSELTSTHYRVIAMLFVGTLVVFLLSTTVVRLYRAGRLSIDGSRADTP